MINLYLMSYSKRRTVNKIRDAFTRAPHQRPNTPEANDGYILEFRTKSDYRPGTLSEYYDVFKETKYRINADDGSFRVTRNNNGNWDQEED